MSPKWTISAAGATVPPVGEDSLIEKFHVDVRVNCVADPGYQVVREAPTLRMVSLHKETPFNMVLDSNLNELNADSIIEREIEYFRQRNEPFEWKLFSYDKPADLGERLRIHGLREGDEESLMVATLDSFSNEIVVAPPVSIVKLASEEALRTLLERVNEAETKPEHLEGLLQNLTLHMRSAPDTIGMYGAYWEGQPVASGWAFYNPNSRFCGLFGGTTHSRYRGKGLYKALVQTRAKEAAEKGYSYLFVDAGPMSRPILEKLGFKELAKMQGFYWSPY